MRRRDTIADKITSGRAETSQSVAWWVRHNLAISHCLHDTEGHALANSASGATAVKVAREWDLITRDNSELMLKHTAHEIALIEAAIEGDSGAVARIQDLLHENAIAQREWLVSQAHGFPVRTFDDHMMDHVRLLVETAVHISTYGNRKMSAYNRKRDRNALSLGILMSEWI